MVCLTQEHSGLFHLKCWKRQSKHPPCKTVIQVSPVPVSMVPKWPLQKLLYTIFCIFSLRDPHLSNSTNQIRFVSFACRTSCLSFKLQVDWQPSKHHVRQLHAPVVPQIIRGRHSRSADVKAEHIARGHWSTNKARAGQPNYHVNSALGVLQHDQVRWIRGSVEKLEESYLEERGGGKWLRGIVARIARGTFYL